MKIKRFYNRFILALPAKKFIAGKNYFSTSSLDAVTVAFNNDKVIDYQIKLIRKFLPANICHIICDNSSSEEVSRKIEQICLDSSTAYIRLPKFLNEDPSRNHGNALNWIYKHVIRKRKNDFALLDHDIFPIRNIYLQRLQETPLCGRVHEKAKGWFLWPGFSFYRYGYMALHKTNFLPCKGLDTGGSNYKSIYKNCASKDVKALKISIYDIYQQKEIPEIYPGFLKSCVEIIDDSWLHITAASNWTDIGQKDKDAYQLLDKYLES